MYQVIFSSACQKQLKRFIKKNPQAKNKFIKVLKHLNKDPSNSSLKLHKLTGENNWSVSISYEIRLVIHLEGRQIYCLRVGSHDQVY